MDSKLQMIRERINEAQAILITAGAGMGVDSGLPDFRGREGFWKAYPIAKELHLSFEDLANPRWFDVKPKLAWAFYGHRFNLYKETVPHQGFTKLLELVKSKDENYFIYTSNVDGQFQKAGFDSEKIYEIHGSISHFQCSKNKSHGIWRARESAIDVDMKKFEANNTPKCSICNALARPNILMFGDWDWVDKRSHEQEERFHQWKKSVKSKKLVIIEVGAGTAIPSVRLLSEHMSATNENATLIRINPREYGVYREDDFSLAMGGLEGIQTILQSQGE